MAPKDRGATSAPPPHSKTATGAAARMSAGGFLRVVACGLVAVFAFAVAGRASSEISIRPIAVDAAVEATVKIKAVTGDPASTAESTGSGFFVHPSGLVLTLEEVVAPCLRKAAQGCRMSVTLHAASGEGQTIPAVVADHDPRRALVLLRVDHRPAAWLRIGETSENLVDDRVWLVGFPVAGDGSATVAEGKVTDLREGPGQQVLAAETDAVAVAGMTGGPMLDLNGSVAGVVRVEDRDGSAKGCAVPANLLHDFGRSREVKIRFNPPKVGWPPEPVGVSANPLLALVDDIAGGVVSCWARGIEPVQVPLELRGTKWRGTIQPPGGGQDRPPVKSYIIQLRFVDGSGAEALVRRYRLEVKRTGAGVAQDSASKRSARPRTLADVASSVKLRVRSDVVIDQDALAWFSSSLVHDFPPERYDQLSCFEHEELATVYDLLQYGIEMAKPLMDEHPEVRAAHDEMMLGLEEVLPEVQRVDLVFCRDDNKWYYRDNVDCSNLMEP